MQIGRNLWAILTTLELFVGKITLFLVFYVKNNTKVAVLGAAGGIGQPLSLLLKMSPLIDQLALYDIVNTPGMDSL